MKVLFISNTVTHYFAALLRKMHQKGIDISIVVPISKSKVVGESVKRSTEAIGYKVIYAEEEIGYYKKARYKGLKNIIKTEKPDLVIFIWPYFLQLFFERNLLQYIKSNNIRLVLREIPFQTPPFKQLSYYNEHPVYNEQMYIESNSLSFKIRSLLTMLIRRFLYKRVDAALTYTSEGPKILSTYGIKPENVYVTYNSSDTEALLKEKEEVLKTPSLLPIKPRIIHIGRLVKWKRVDLLIEAFSIVKQHIDVVELLIVGDGPELNNLKEQAEQTGLSNDIRFVGGIYDSFTLGKYMSESTIYVLAGMGGLSINDAMTYELPVICSVCDGTEKDLVQDGVNGLFFKNGDAKDLANKILHLLENRELASQFGRESAKIIANKINLSTVSTRFINAFYAIIGDYSDNKENYNP